MMSVEHRHVPEGREAVVQYMMRSGYTVVADTPDNGGNPSDVIFVRNDISITTMRNRE